MDIPSPALLPLTLPASWLYGLGATLHGKFRAFRPYYPAVPTISIGNLTVGGTGKTPLTAWLAQHFAQLGYQVAILSRGHGGSIKEIVRVDPLAHRASEVGDEPLSLARAFPNLPIHVWVGRNRARAAQRAEAAGATLLLLDDGFQRQDVARQVNILVLDAARGFGNRLCLPAGPLREPLAGRKRASFAIIVSEIPNSMPSDPIWQGLPAYRLTLGTQLPDKLKGKPLVAMSALGRNDKFYNAIGQAGGQVVATIPYPDHHRYTLSEVTAAKATAKAHQATLVTTPKDAVKLPGGTAIALPPQLTGHDTENILADIQARLA